MYQVQVIAHLLAALLVFIVIAAAHNAISIVSMQPLLDKIGFEIGSPSKLDWQLHGGWGDY